MYVEIFCFKSQKLFAGSLVAPLTYFRYSSNRRVFSVALSAISLSLISLVSLFGWDQQHSMDSPLAADWTYGMPSPGLNRNSSIAFMVSCSKYISASMLMCPS